MARVCPVDFRDCPDDICRGSGTCGRSGHDMLDRCDRCNQPVNEFIWCNCEPDDRIEDDEDTDA